MQPKKTAKSPAAALKSAMINQTVAKLAPAHAFCSDLAAARPALA
jgi:hypothetical protein